MIYKDLNIEGNLDKEPEFSYYYKLRKQYLELCEGYPVKGVYFLPDDSCNVDNKIYIAINQKKLTREEKAKVLTGLFLHEFGHSIYTKLTKEIQVKWGNELFAWVFNTIEDERMERKLSKHFLYRYIGDTKDYYFADAKCTDILTYLLLYVRYPKNIDAEYPKLKEVLDTVLKPFPETIQEVDRATELILSYLGKRIDSLKIPTYIAVDIMSKNSTRILVQNNLMKAAKNKDRRVFNSEKEEIDFSLVHVIQDIQSSLKDKASYDSIKNDILPDILRLRNIFKLRQRQVTKNRRGLYVGDLDSDELIPAMLGQKNVYEAKRSIIANGFRIVLLIDLSGSMRGSGVEKARAFSILLYESLKALKDVEVSIIGHTTIDFGSSATLLSKFYPTYNGMPPYALVKMFGKADNRDGHALNIVHKMLRESTQERVILLMLSDGEPQATLPKGQDGMEELRKAVALAEKDNIDIFHIATGEDAFLPNIYRRSIYIANFWELETLFKKIVLSQL